MVRSRVSPSTAELASRFEARLRALGTAKRAAAAKAYLKSELEFLGVDTPTLRRELKRLLREVPEPEREGLLALVESLWGRGVFELRAAAAELLTMRAALLEAPDLELLERLIREGGTWALVDALAPSVAGPLVEREAERHPEIGAILDRWAADESFWVRRAALLVHLLPLRRGAGDFARFTRYADAMLEERELFVRKAIGWVLREVGRRRPVLVTEWLLPRAGRASGMTVRDAIKYLPAEDRQEILAAYRSGR